MPDPRLYRSLYLGLDLGTSGARAVVIDAAGAVRASGRAAAFAALDRALAKVEPRDIAAMAMAVDGTSGTLPALDAGGEPLGDALMYDDRAADPEALARIDAAAPATSAARGPTSDLAKAFALAACAPRRILHQETGSRGGGSATPIIR
jgi:sugar (pentulose or hexulose) kinase